MNTQLQEETVSLTLVEGGLATSQEFELPFQFSLQNFMATYFKNRDQQMEPSER